MKKRILSILLAVISCITLFSSCSPILEQGAPTKDAEAENYYYFGTFPQAEVKDEALKATLNEKAGELPTSAQANHWNSYGYTRNGVAAEDFMWYFDVSHQNERYRAVYFTAYRAPYFNNPPEAVFPDGGETAEPNATNSNNGYEKNKVHWFKFQPIRWQVLKEETVGDERYLDLVCDVLLTADVFLPLCEGLRNTYHDSSVRRWLTEDFYQTAFNLEQSKYIQTTEVDNSIETTRLEEQNNLQPNANTQDKVWLISYQEANQLLTAEQRMKNATDYAKCQSINVQGGVPHWWTRSQEFNGYYISTSAYGGNFGVTATFDNTTGVCPAIKVKI